MNKRIISLVLALVMVLGTFTSVFAAEADKEAKKPENGEKVEKVVGKDQKIQYVIEKKFVEGYEDGSYGYDKNIKRAEITRLLVLANGHEDLAKKLQGSMRIYSDVDTNHWANGVITVGTTKPSDANGIPFLVGYPDKSFKPENDVTYAELAKMLVVLVKKDLTKEMHDNAIWASSWMTWAAELGILEDVTIVDSNAPATRADAFVMLYNALYAMKYIKRMPANETMGILSQLKNNELTINQGEKAKTFKLTNETVFVLYNQHNTLDVNADKKADRVNRFAQAVKVSAINNPSFYYGSLIRVLTNDKNEVTHILELGNPRDLALGHVYKDKWDNSKYVLKDYVIDPNRRWADVADATVETSSGAWVYKNCCDEGTQLDTVAAKINYKDGSANSIDFVEGTFVKKPVNETKEWDDNNFEIAGGWFKPDLRITNGIKPSGDDYYDKYLNVRLTGKTRYFVADVAQNQLTEVSGVEQAITILGLTRASNWFFDVYVGYDNVSGRDRIEHSKYPTVEGFNEATVVVFNSVQKDNNAGQLLRARQQSTNLYDVRLEDTDGKTVVDNYKEYRNGMQFVNARTEAGKAVEVANLDVVKVTRNNAYGVDVLVKIDHSDTQRYPIAKVKDIDGRTLILEGEYGETASIVLDTDYDKFISKDKLIGRYIQFHTAAKNVNEGRANDTNVVDIVSVLPDNYDWAVKGSLRNVLHANEKHQHAGKVSTIDFTQVASKQWQIIVHDYRNLYDTSQNKATDTYVISETERNALYAWLNCEGYTSSANREDIRFKLRPGVNATDEMFDVEVYVNGEWVLVREIFQVNMGAPHAAFTGADYQALLNGIKALEAKAPVVADLKVEDIENIKDLSSKLAAFQALVPYKCHLPLVAQDLVDYVGKAVGELPRLEAQRDYDNFVADAKSLAMPEQAQGTQQDLENAVKAALEALKSYPAVQGTVTITVDGTAGFNGAPGSENPVNVLITSDNADVVDAPAFDVIVNIKA